MGRPKGAQNKITTAARELADELGINPLQVLLYFAANDYESLGYDGPFQVVKTTETKDGPMSESKLIITSEIRMNAAREAVRYIYPTQKAVELKGENAGFNIILKDYEPKK